MSLYVWPEGILPAEPLNDQYKVTPPDPLTRTDFEQGASRQRLAYTNAPGFFDVQWPMTPAQKYIFDGVYKNELMNGACWFSILIFANLDYQPLKVRFVKASVSFTRSGGEWICAARLEADDIMAPSATDTAAAMITFGSDDSLEDIVDELYHVVHVDYPAAAVLP